METPEFACTKTRRRENFLAGMASIRTIVGSANVVVEESEVDRRSRDTIPTVRLPSAFVWPGSVEEIQAILAIANEFRLALWPVSKGRNWGYGAATPQAEGAIVLVLERMNRILEIDEKLAYVVLEPGVTYRQLYQFLKDQRSALWLDATDGPADGSVMGNALERGIGETPYGDHFGNICGMEVILPNGQMMRTGGGPFADYKSWNTYKWGVGPCSEGLFSQSNFGVVTKIGMWLMPRPECFRSCLFELREGKDLAALIDALRRLQLNGAIQSKVHLINDITALAIIAQYPADLVPSKGTIPDPVRLELCRKFNIAPWIFAGGVYGTKEQVRAHIRLIKKELSVLGKLRFLGDLEIRIIEAIAKPLRRAKANPASAGFADFILRHLIGKSMGMLDSLPHIHQIEQGIPSDFFVKHAYYKARVPKPADHDVDPARDGCGLVWLGPLAPLEGGHIEKLMSLCQPLYRKYRFDFPMAIMVANPRTMIALMSILYDKSDPEETARAQALYLEMGDITQAAGYQQYRTSTLYMDRLLQTSPEFRAFADTIKSALDPNNILAPGKYGIGINETRSEEECAP